MQEAEIDLARKSGARTRKTACGQ